METNEIKVGDWTDAGLVYGRYKDNDNAYRHGCFIYNFEGKLTRNLKPTELKLVDPPNKLPYDSNILGYVPQPTIGSDPEIFIRDKDRQIIPAFAFLPDKTKPHIIEPRGIRSTIYNDGFQAEFTTSAEGQSCLAHTVDRFNYNLQELLNHARKFNPTAQLCTRSLIEIPEIFLTSAPPEYVQLGCSPSRNIYGDAGLEVVNGRALRVRFAGAHLHFGTPIVYKHHAPFFQEDKVEDITHALDIIAGIASIALFGHRENINRRKYYGQAGEYRLPKHGYEYRVISARMLSHPVFIHIVFGAARQAFNMARLGIFKYWNKNNIKVVREVINTSDQPGAIELIKENEKLWRSMINASYLGRYDYNDAVRNEVFQLLTGTRKLISNGMEKNWYLNHEPTQNPAWQTHSASSNCCVVNMKTEAA